MGGQEAPPFLLRSPTAIPTLAATITSKPIPTPTAAVRLCSSNASRYELEGPRVLMYDLSATSTTMRLRGVLLEHKMS